MIKRALKSALAEFGYEIVRPRPTPDQIFIPNYGRSTPEEIFPPDFDSTTKTLWWKVERYTMTSPERVSALRAAVEYVLMNKIPGDIVECGVWKGGSMMVCALTLLAKSEWRDLWLFDTFEGMPPPKKVDIDLQGNKATQILEEVKAQASLDEVQKNIESTGYPSERVKFVNGRVEDTIPGSAPQRIALLRLDTDWYESTYHELVHMYPRLSPGGVLLIDDYGHWAGSRKATDQYFEEHGMHPLLHRIDYTARLLVKPA
jgi:O-methyltransferase